MSKDLAQSDPAEGSREVIERELARGDQATTERTVTHAEVLAAVRDADDRLVTEVLTSGATLAEFTHALAWLNDDDAAHEAGLPPPSGRAAVVLNLLREAEAERVDDERQGR
jgi:hypothetical protein